MKMIVNRREIEVEKSYEDYSLLEFLNHHLNLTGTKFSCGIGVCRGCTVLLKNKESEDWSRQPSCITPIKSIPEYEIMTIEGLTAPGEPLSEIQTAFLKEFSFQCGYCTPGFVMSAVAFVDYLKRTPVKLAKLDEEIESWFKYNICRCTGYERYFSAIKKVARKYVQG